ncbi:MAG: 1-acyl-sn-glycerol-3-phosphate acyltransferase [Treponema sp.]|nr:1-acyl-sn-glycerol-3-phosphate acyltransferase [Treponema sp.]
MKFDKNKIITPDLGIKYPEIPDERLLSKPKIYEINLDENYPYIDKSFKHRFISFWQYIGTYILVFSIAPLIFGLRICARKNITKNKKLFKNGAITISNHVYRWDFLGVLQAIRYRRSWFPALAENLCTSDRALIRNAGGIPVPSTIKALGAFNKAFDELHAKKQWIHLFPESCRWDYYQYIRPFKKGAFTFAYKYNLPIIPMAFSFRKPNKFEKLFTGGKPCITLNVGEPIMPKIDLGRKECVRVLREECHKKMIELAGLDSNPWSCEGD